jgi:hypothetical protein
VSAAALAAGARGRSDKPEKLFMIRLTMALVVVLGALSPASAALVRKKDDPNPGGRVPPRLAAQDKPAEQGGADLVINDDTEIKLDGHECKYADVPQDAQIILLDVSSDKKVIKKIHFRTKK